MPTLSTLTALKEYADVASSDTSHDAYLTTILEAVEARFINAVGWAIVSGERTIYRDDLTGVQFVFPYGPVTALTMARLSDFAGDTFDDVTSGTYRLRNEDRYSWVEYPSGFADGTTYRLTHTVGYASNAIPDDIAHCINITAATEYARSPKAGLGRDWDLKKRGKDDKGVAIQDEWMSIDDLRKLVWEPTVSTYRAR